MRFASAVVGAFALCVAAFPAAAESGAVIRADDLKAMPFIDAATSAKLPANQPVNILNRKGGWIEVEANGQTGWVRMLNVRLRGKQPGAGPGQRPRRIPAAHQQFGQDGHDRHQGAGRGGSAERRTRPCASGAARRHGRARQRSERERHASGLVEQQAEFFDEKPAKPKKK